MRYLKILAQQVKLSVMSTAIYRANFLLMILGSFLHITLSLLCIEIIYGNVDSIAGWDRREMLILVCTAMIVNQLYRVIMHFNQNRFLYGIGSGGFDRMLLRPISLIFQANTGSVNVFSLISALVPLVGVLVIQITAIGTGISLLQ